MQWASANKSINVALYSFLEDGRLTFGDGTRSHVSSGQVALDVAVQNWPRCASPGVCGADTGGNFLEVAVALAVEWGTSTPMFSFTGRAQPVLRYSTVRTSQRSLIDMNDQEALKKASEDAASMGCSPCSSTGPGPDVDYPVPCFAGGTGPGYPSRHALLVRFPGAFRERFLQYDMCGTFNHLIPSPSPSPSASTSPSASACPPRTPARIGSSYTMWAKGSQGHDFNGWGNDGGIGMAVAAVGDVDGSGTDDILITESSPRRVWLGLTSPSGDRSVGTLVHVTIGATPPPGIIFNSGSFGQSLAGLGALHGGATLTTVAIGASTYSSPASPPRQ